MFSRNIVILNWKTVIFLLLIIFLNGVIHSEIDNETVVNYSTTEIMEELEKEYIEDSCSTSNLCSQLQYPCIQCKLDNISCNYGSDILVECSALDGVNCEGVRDFNLTMKCRYCYQANSWEYKCVKKFSCKSVSSPQEYYRTNCTVNNDVICLGKRRFLKKELCNWTDGYKWSTTLILSITLGGFGADRFYLGHWQEGIGKLFSFGGLGVWTLIDVLLISLHYLGPADGSLYI